MNSFTSMLLFGLLIGIIQCTQIPSRDEDRHFGHVQTKPWMIQRPYVLPKLMDGNHVHDHIRIRRQNQASVGVGRSRGGGTNVNAEAQARLWESRNGKSTVDGNANYNQRFSGPGGRSPPNYGAGVTFRHKF